MKMWIAVVEDEAIYQEQLRDYLERLARESGYSLSVDYYADAGEFRRSKKSYEILLLDIFLGKEEDGGLQLARDLRREGNRSLIFFVTNMAQYAICGYSVEAFRFLVKPVAYEAFAKQMQRAFNVLESCRPKRVCIQTRGGAQCINVADILYVESHRRGIYLHTKKEVLTSTQPLKTMEDQLDSRQFFRCHVAFLVNLQYIDRVESMSAFVEDKEIPVSRHRKKEFMNALVNFLGEGSEK